MAGLTFREFAQRNMDRCRRWHNPEDWTLADWAVAAVGELGEACNVLKKLKRLNDGIANLNEDPDRQLSNMSDAMDKIAEEIADTVIYLDLLMQRIGHDMASEIRAKFNKVSERYNFPERL